ncbi:MAG: transcriptional regulator [Flavobacteriales bacterium]
MYVPKFNEENNLDTLYELIRKKPLGAWSTLIDGEIVVNHIPFILHENRGEYGTLVGHVARSNPVWKSFSHDINSVVVFQGDQSYISPSWYPSKQQHGKAVPTWNYVVAHAHGIPKAIEDVNWLLEHVNELTDIHEQNQSFPWKVSDAPKEFVEKLARAIVGIEIPVIKLSGKFKLGQNRPEADQQGIISRLESKDNAQAQGLAKELDRFIQYNKPNT